MCRRTTRRKLYGGQRDRNAQRRQRANKFHGLRLRHFDRYANYGPGTGNCVRGSGECPLPDVLCKPGAAGPTEPAACIGSGQISTGQAFQPVTVRVTDSSSPPNAVLGAGVSFQTTVLRPGGTLSTGGGGETNPGNPAMPVILAVNQKSHHGYQRARKHCAFSRSVQCSLGSGCRSHGGR